MPLKPSDIEHKTFSTALRGYDLGEVDDFLDEVIGTIRDLEERMTALQTSRPVVAPGPTADPVEEASAVGRALIIAQETADRLTNEAKEGADRVLTDARAEAEQMLTLAQAEAEQMRNEARIEAEQMRNDARVEADTLAAEREALRQEASTSIAALSDRVAKVRAEILALSGMASERVDEMDTMLEEAREFLSRETDSGEPGGGRDMDGTDEQGSESHTAAELLENGYTPDGEDSGDGYSEDSDDSDDSEDSDESGDSADEYDSEDTEDEPDSEEAAEDDEDEDDDDDDDAMPVDPDFEPWNPDRSEG